MSAQPEKTRKTGPRALSRALLGAEAGVALALGSVAVAAGAPPAAALAGVAATALGARAAALGYLAAKAANESRLEGVAWPRQAPLGWLGFGARGMASAIKAQWAQMPWGRAWSAREQIALALGTPGPLVVICPGYACSSAPMAEWRRSLEARGFCVCVFECSQALGSIDGHARELSAFCEQARSELGRSPWLLGHSMGGLVCLRAALDGAGALGVAVVGSPLEGTLRASGGHGVASRQMSRGSPWLSGLKSQWTSSAPAPLLCVWSACDQIISPNTSASGEGWGARSEARWEGMGHLEMLGPKAAAAVAGQMVLFVKASRVGQRA